MLNKTKAALQSCQCHYQMFKQEQNTRVSAGGQSLSQRNPYVQINRVRLTYGHRYPLNNFNYREMRELANTLIIPKNANGAVRLPQIEALEEINNLVPESHLVHGSSTIGGWVSEAFLYHEENHNVAVLHRNPDLAYERVVPQSHEVNRVVTHSYQVNRVAKRYAESKTSLRGAVQCVETYEIFVGHSITESNPVQLSGSDLAFLRCSDLSLRPQASRTHAEKLAPALSAFSRSTLASISSISSCGNRIFFCADLAFTALVAIYPPAYSEGTPYQKNSLTCTPTENIVGVHLEVEDTQDTAKPGSVTSTNRASDHNVTEAYIMACIQHTQTRPKYQYRFLALSAIGRNVIHITATTEREAREQSPDGCVMVFAGRLPVREGHHA